MDTSPDMDINPDNSVSVESTGTDPNLTMDIAGLDNTDTSTDTVATTNAVDPKIIEALRWIDTVHDFYPVNATNARGEDIREILKDYYDRDVGNYFKTRLFSPGDTDVNISPSAVEVQTEKYYSKKFNIITVDDKSSVNVKTIIDKYQKENAQTVLNGLGVFEYAEEAKLQLCLTNRDFFKDKPRTNFLAEVIQRFFFKGTDTTRDIYFLIDATFGRLDCMFQDIDQASTLINVLSIGDSAVTSVTDKQSKTASGSCGVPDFQNKFKRKTYLPNNYTLPYNSTDNKYNITSNEFTKNEFELWYADSDKPFSKENNAAIKLVCKYLKGQKEEWFTEFSILKSGSPNSGASVGILKNLIQILNGLNTGNKAAIITGIYTYYKANMVTQLNLAPILKGMIDANIPKETIIKFLFDYKRAGDHEQVNSARYLYKDAPEKHDVVLLTGDRLCSLYARLMKQPCIYVHDDKYDMYRFLRELSQDDQNLAAENLLKNTTDLVKTKMDIYKGFTFTDAAKFEEIKQNINTYLTTLTSAPAPVDDFYNKLYRISFQSLLVKIQIIQDRALSIKNEALGLFATIDTMEIDELNKEYNKFLIKYKELMEYLTFKDEKNPEQITSKNVAKFKSSAFGYDNKVFNNVRSYFDDFKGEMKVIRESARDRDVQLAIKRNKIRSWGGGDIYESLIEDFIAFINTCLANYGLEPLNGVALETFENKDKVAEIRGLIDTQLAGDLLTQTSNNYNDIIREIQAFLERNIPESLRPPPTAIPMVIETPAELESVISVSGVIESETNMSGGGEALKEVIKKAHATVLANQMEIFLDIKRYLLRPHSIEQFTLNLNRRLKKEYELFFGKFSVTDTELIHYLREYLREYLKNLMLLHINHLVYACFETIYDLIDSDKIINAYTIVYDYIYKLIDERYTYAMNEPYRFIFHRGGYLGKTIKQTEEERLLMDEYISQLQGLAEMQIKTAAAQRKEQINALTVQIKPLEIIVRRRDSNPYPTKLILETKAKIDLLKRELNKLEEKSTDSTFEMSAHPPVNIVPGIRTIPHTKSLYAPIKEDSNIRVLTPQLSNTRGDFVLNSSQGSQSKRVKNGGKRIRTRKYITKKKKRTRKLNKRLKNKKRTKHQKYKVKKHTRKHYRKI